MIPAQLVNTLGALESYPVLDTITKEVVGINAPKIALTRTSTERKDVAISEIGNTMAFALGGLGVDHFLKRVFATAQKKEASQAAHQWATIGRSVGVYSTVFSLMWAIPFVRNYITAKQTGNVDFTSVIKAESRHKKHSHEQKAALNEALDYYKNTALTILGLGAGGTVASAAIARMAASAKKPFAPSLLHFLFKAGQPGAQASGAQSLAQQYLLKGGKFAGFGGMPALLFWGIPAYGGWLHASRDPYEKKEQWLKCVNFMACFFLPPVVMNRIFARKFARQFPQLKEMGYGYQQIKQGLQKQPAKMEKALQLWAQKNLWSLLSSIILLGTMPQLINIYWTNFRLKRDAEAQETLAAAATTLGEASLAYKNEHPWQFTTLPATNTPAFTRLPLPTILPIQPQTFSASVYQPIAQTLGDPSPFSCNPTPFSAKIDRSANHTGFPF